MFKRIWEFFNPSRPRRQVETVHEPFNESKNESAANSDEMFHELLNRSRRVSRNEFASNFGGIAEDIVEMLNSDRVNQAIQEARKTMEDDSDDSCLPPLRKWSLVIQ